MGGKTLDAYQLFLASIHSEATRVSYEIGLKEFLKHTKLTHQKLLKLDQKKIEDHVISFIMYLKNEKKVSNQTAKNRLAGIVKFCEANDVYLNVKKLKSFIGPVIRTVKDRAYTKEEIQRMLEFADERKKAVILFLVSTGVRVGAVEGITLGDLKKHDNVYEVRVYARANEEYTTFTTPECTAAIDLYLEHRRKLGENLNAKSPLFRQEFKKSDANTKIKVLRTHGIAYLVRDLSRSAGVSVSSGDYRKRNEIMLVHGFRKFMNSSLIRAGVKPIVADELLGHETGLQQQSYYKPTVEELLGEYLKALDLLTISKEKELQQEVVKLQVKAGDMEDLKKMVLQLRMENLELKERDKTNSRLFMESELRTGLEELEEVEKKKVQK